MQREALNEILEINVPLVTCSNFLDLKYWKLKLIN